MDETDLDSPHALERQLSTISSLYRRNVAGVGQRKRISSELAEEKKEKLIQDENILTGRVKPRVYWVYVKAASLTFSALFVSMFVVYSGFQLGRSMWLSAWADENDRLAQHPDEQGMGLGSRLGVYAGFGCVESELGARTDNQVH